MRIWLAAPSQGSPGPLIGLVLVSVEHTRDGGVAVDGEKWEKRLGSLLLKVGLLLTEKWEFHQVNTELRLGLPGCRGGAGASSQPSVPVPAVSQHSPSLPFSWEGAVNCHVFNFLWERNKP